MALILLAGVYLVNRVSTAVTDLMASVNNYFVEWTQRQHKCKQNQKRQEYQERRSLRAKEYADIRNKYGLQ